MTLIVAVDFDGTLVEHEFPKVGREVPGAFSWLRKFQKAGALLILWTMRSRGQRHESVFADAIEFCRDRGVEFWGFNENPTQGEWTSSPKAYAHVYIDDAAACCPLRPSKKRGGRPMVDWRVVGPAVMKLLRTP